MRYLYIIFLALQRCSKLRSKIRELEFAEDKKRLQTEQTEATKNELVQRLGVMTAAKARLEREFGEYKRSSETSINSLKQEINENERRSQQNHMRVENLTKILQEYEEAFLALYGVGMYNDIKSKLGD